MEFYRLIDHSAFLFDRNDKYVLFFPPGTPPRRIAAVRDELGVREKER